VSHPSHSAAPTSERRKPLARANNARERLLDAAERLLAEHGIDGVSLRGIGAAAGQGNPAVIQYHFGDKAGLINEIIARHAVRCEPRRRQLLDEGVARGKPWDIASFLRVVYLPLWESVDAEGRHTYARFVMQFMTSFRYFEGMEGPHWDDPNSNWAGTRAIRLLREQLPFLAPDDLARRMGFVGCLFFAALLERDNATARGHRVEPAPVFLAELFAMMAAALETRRVSATRMVSKKPKQRPPRRDNGRGQRVKTAERNGRR
jgi:AcrR family transcriptional regulator